MAVHRRRRAQPACITSPSCIPRAALAEALRRVLKAEIPLEGASDHGVSEALYLRDPDGNGVELYRDRPADQWPRNPDGSRSRPKASVTRGSSPS